MQGGSEAREGSGLAGCEDSGPAGVVLIPRWRRPAPSDLEGLGPEAHDRDEDGDRGDDEVDRHHLGLAAANLGWALVLLSFMAPAPSMAMARRNWAIQTAVLIAVFLR
jgi:hypothetical protein